MHNANLPKSASPPQNAVVGVGGSVPVFVTTILNSPNV
jgi:hypothetical protein